MSFGAGVRDGWENRIAEQFRLIVLRLGIVRYEQAGNTQMVGDE